MHGEIDKRVENPLHLLSNKSGQTTVIQRIKRRLGENYWTVKTLNI